MTEASGESCSLNPKSPFLATPAQQKDWEGIEKKGKKNLFFLVMDPFFPQLFVRDTTPPASPTVRCTPVVLRQIHQRNFGTEFYKILGANLKGVGRVQRVETDTPGGGL